jgi:predicted dinucleotide-binding enzyme
VGLRPVDCGPLSNSLMLEAIAFQNIWLNATQGGDWNSAWKLVR